MPAPKTPYQPYAELHVEPNGAGDARPTSMQILEDLGLVGNKLHGKAYLVTGCSAGIGIETARALHATGADVYMTVRENKKDIGEKVVQDILSNSPGKGKLELVFVDLAQLASIREASTDILKRVPVLNGLILNAGVMLCPMSLTVDGFEMHMGTNHFGHFLLFQLLKQRLLDSATPEMSSRVVVVTSAGHRFDTIHFEDMHYAKREYQPMAGYGQSKTANIYMANSIERHYGAQNLHATSVHPGVIFETELSRHTDMTALEGMFDMAALKRMAKSLSQGAATQVWAALVPYFNDKGGVLLGDCGEVGPMNMNGVPGMPGYAAHAYDEDAEERLWKVSCEAVGVSQD